MAQPHHSAKNPFGIFGNLLSSRVILPLKGVQCDFRVFGGVVEVTMVQIFRQENPQPMDCSYLFPLPTDASVYACAADINGRVIRAEVRERQEAVKLAAEHKAQGHRTALVEAERDNLFTLNLTNLQPQDVILVTLKYIQPLRHLAGENSLEIPLCPGIRYIPGKPLLRSNKGLGVVDDTDQVPDASRISPPRIDEEHPDAAFVDIRGVIDDLWVEDGSVQSPSHAVDFAREEEGILVALTSGAEVPDRDFVLRWKALTPGTVSCHSFRQQVGAETYTLLELKAPEHLSTLNVPVDFYFLVDRSGSMQGVKWYKAIEAVQSCARLLGENDRMMVTLFENQYHDFAEKPLPAAELLKDAQFQNLDEVGARGGTEMAQGLKHVKSLVRQHSQGRCTNVILITDAQLGNEQEILHCLADEPGLAVHCFGIDDALNDSLLVALARQQGGTFHSLNPNDDIAEKVSQLAQTIRTPVLTELAVSEGWETGLGFLPNLYSGHSIYASARTNVFSKLEIFGKDAAGNRVPLEIKFKDTKNTAPFLQWHKERMQQLLAGNRLDEATKLSVKSNLICRTTAFVAWDDSEKVVIATRQITQPVMDVRYAVLGSNLASVRHMLGSVARKGYSASSSTGAGEPPMEFGDADSMRCGFTSRLPGETPMESKTFIRCHQIISEVDPLFGAGQINKLKAQVRRLMQDPSLIESIETLITELETTLNKLKDERRETARQILALADAGHVMAARLRAMSKTLESCHSAGEFNLRFASLLKEFERQHDLTPILGAIQNIQAMTNEIVAKFNGFVHQVPAAKASP